LRPNLVSQSVSQSAVIGKLRLDFFNEYSVACVAGIEKPSGD
jgi:hypothetical protein